MIKCSLTKFIMQFNFNNQMKQDKCLSKLVPFYILEAFSFIAETNIQIEINKIDKIPTRKGKKKQ